MRKGRNARGFTLVEVIVVLVILAILAAIMIPAMTRWIDKANAKKCIHEMGLVARDYGACAAESGYGKVTALDTAACVNAACEDILGHGSGGALSYTGTCGNTITLYLTADETAVRDAYCPEHGYLRGSGAVLAGGTAPNVSLVDALTNAVHGTGISRWTANYDSTAVNAQRTPTILAYLAQHGVDLSALGITSWSVRGVDSKAPDNADGTTNAQFFWTDVDVSAAANKSKVRVIQYDAATGLYSAGYITVSRENNGGDPYNRLGTTAGDYGFSAADGVTASTDYASVAAAFNDLPAKKS